MLRLVRSHQPYPFVALGLGYNQGLETSAIQRNIFDERAVNQGAHRPVRCIYQRRARLRRDGLSVRPKRHVEVDVQNILDVQHHFRPPPLLEAGLFDFQAIAARRQIRQVKFAGVVGRGFVAKVCASVEGGDLRIAA